MDIDRAALDRLHPPADRNHPYAALGVAVLRQAIDDWRWRGCPTGDDPLIYFLLDSRCAWLGFWCALAGLRPEALRERLAERQASPPAVG